MSRSAMIAAVVGMLLADPLLCRVGDAERLCSTHALPVQLRGTDAPDREPAEPCGEASHSCVCQGATAKRSGDAVQLSTHPEKDATALPIRSGFSQPRTRHVAVPPDRSRTTEGRAVRIRNQSLLN